MALNIRFVSPVQLSAQARAAADVVTEADDLSVFLPAIENRTLDFDLDNDSVGLPRAATFRSYDSTAPYGREESVGSRKGSLPASSIKLPLGELQQLQIQKSDDATIANALERKARQNGQSIGIRAIIARGQAISTGSVTLNENHLVAEIDFGRASALSVNAAVLWSDHVNADPISDLESWQTTYGLDLYNGGPAVGYIASGQVLAALATSAKLIAFAYPTATVRPDRISASLVKQVLADMGFTEALQYDKVYKDYDGNAVRPIAANKFLLVPSRDNVAIDAGPLGNTQWGVPAEALDAKAGISDSEAPGIYAGAYDRDDPVGMDVLASSIFLPVLTDPNAVMDATVLA